MLNEKENANTTTTELDTKIDACFETGATYWRDFPMTPRGRNLIADLPDKTYFLRAFELFQFGFVGRMLLVPNCGESIFGQLFRQIYCKKLWFDYLRNSHGEIILDGDRYPATPRLILNTAEKFFREGFIAADCECVCNTVDNSR